MEGELMPEFSTKESTYVGVRPFTYHIYIADWKQPDHIPTNIVLHYGDDSIEVSPKEMWDVLCKLFERDK